MMGQMITPPMAALRPMVRQRCCCSRAARWSGVRIWVVVVVVVGVAIVSVILW